MRITSIESVPPQTVYAVQTSTGTFIADGLAHHNCYNCNVNLKGSWVEYEKHLIEEYGQETVDNLKQRKHEIKKMKAHEWEELAEKYKQKYKELE